MNLDGVCGDARKRLEQAALAAIIRFDLRPECLLCGRRDEHTHGPDLNYAPQPQQ
jgi:hypothetical protein